MPNSRARRAFSRRSSDSRTCCARNGIACDDLSVQLTEERNDHQFGVVDQHARAAHVGIDANDGRRVVEPLTFLGYFVFEVVHRESLEVLDGRVEFDQREFRVHEREEQRIFRRRRRIEMAGGDGANVAPESERVQTFERRRAAVDSVDEEMVGTAEDEIVLQWREKSSPDSVFDGSWRMNGFEDRKHLGAILSRTNEAEHRVSLFV